MRRLAVAATLSLGLHGCSSFDPCAPGEAIDVIGPVSAETWTGVSLHVDSAGYAMFWTHSVAGEGGVWAARPGHGAVRVNADAAAKGNAAIAVASGYLICWAGTSRWEGECFRVDSMFRRVSSGVAPDFGAVRAAGRAGQAIGARGGGSDGDVLFAIDEDGRPTSAPVPWPCERARDYAWAPAGVACLMASDPLCGTQFYEPPDCVTDLHVYDFAGERLLLVPAVAPYGNYQEWTDVQLAARDDGFLISWIDADGWHAQAVAVDGALGARIEETRASSYPYGSSLHASDDGYVAVWSDTYADCDLPRVLRVAPDGTAGVAEWLAEPVGPLTGHSAHTAAAAGTSGGVAVAWEAAGGVDATDHIAVLRFRALGCSGNSSSR